MQHLQNLAGSHLIARKGMVTPGHQIFASDASPKSQTTVNLTFVMLSFCRRWCCYLLAFLFSFSSFLRSPLSSDFQKKWEIDSKNMLKVKEYDFGNLHTLLCMISAFVLKYSLVFVLFIYTGSHIRNNILRTKPVPRWHLKNAKTHHLS